MKAVGRAGMLLAVFVLTACAGIIHKPVDSKRAAERVEARELVLALGARNHDLSSFKGIGRFKLRQGGKVQTARAAWVGSYPDKLRIAVMNPAGQPMVSLSTDGQFLYLVSHSEGKFYKKPSANPTLQELISIPIAAADIISLLTARLPIRAYHTVELTADESGRGYILTLSRRWRGVTEKIYLDTDKRTVLQVEIFEASGNLSYRTVFQGKHHLNDFHLPEMIMISDTEGNRFELDVDQYWADVPLAPSTFVLTPP